MKFVVTTSNLEKEKIVGKFEAETIESARYIFWEKYSNAKAPARWAFGGYGGADVVLYRTGFFGRRTFVTADY